MPKGPIIPVRELQEQPDASDTLKAQKRYSLTDVYDPMRINSELDWLHSRVNLILVEGPAIDDLAISPTVEELSERVNLLTELCRSAGLLRRS